MNSSLMRGYLLLQQNNPRKAEEEARTAIEADINAPEPYGLLALALARQKKYKESLQAAETGLGLDPGSSHMHSILGAVCMDTGDYKRARHHLDEAISLDPYSANYHAQSAALYLAQSQSAKALEAAERGLECDPEDIESQNLRSRALIMLGRQNEAHDTLDDALRRNPENSDTHANRGFALLHQNRPKEALDHFREAMRLDPEDGLARFGIVEALKARNPIYRVLLQYFLWLSRMPVKTRWIIVIAPIIALKVLRNLFAETNPALVITVGVLYFLFVLTTWTAVPLFNLLLRLDPVGKYALDKEQNMESLMVGSCIAIAIVLALSYFVVSEYYVFIAALIALSLMMPLSNWFGAKAGSWKNFVMRTYISLLCATFVAGLVLAFMGLENTATAALVLYIFALMAFTWIANVLRS